MLAIVYERVALMRRVRSVSAISLVRADKDIDAGPGGQVVLELQRAGYERIGAFLGLLAGRHKEPRCLSEVEILDEIEADTYEECRLAVGVTFVEHLVAPVRNRRKAARLDRDKRATARIEHWLESEAATA